MKNLIIMFLLGLGLLYSEPELIPLYIGSKEFIVEIADTVEKRLRGLMFREHIPENFGMLFIFEREDIQGFWMKNTRTNLDIIFMNENKQVINMILNVPPCTKSPCPVYRSTEPAKYVLELRGNRSKSLNLKVGDVVFFILKKQN